MSTISDLKEICEVIEREYGADGNIVIQIRDADGSLINGTYVESMSRDSSGTLYLRGYGRGSRSKTGLCQSYSLEEIEKTIQKIRTTEYDFYNTYNLMVSPDMKEQVKNSVKLPENIKLMASPFVEKNKAYLLKVGEDILKPRIGFDRRAECPYYDKDLGCSECAAEHCDYY